MCMMSDQTEMVAYGVPVVHAVWSNGVWISIESLFRYYVHLYTIVPRTMRYIDTLRSMGYSAEVIVNTLRQSTRRYD